MRSEKLIQGIIFDLDGTLLDTAPTLAFVLNIQLKRHHCPPIPCTDIRPIVSQGTKALLKKGFNIEANDPKFLALREEFLSLYETHINKFTNLFVGMVEVLEYLRQEQLIWGIVTNKLEKLTHHLISYFPLLGSAKFIIGGDTLGVCKPHPDPLLKASKLLHYAPKRCVYIGDSQGDIQAGNSAGMKTLLALYGYLKPNDAIETWKATAFINTPLEIIDWLKQSPEFPS